MLNFIISKLLRICSKEPSLIGRATRQEPARSGLTVTFPPFRAPETSQAGLCARPWDRPAPVLLQAPANHEPSPSAPPPGETLIQHLKQNCRTCLSVWELSRLSLPSTTRLYLQPCCCPGAGGCSRVRSVTASLWLLFEKLLGSALLRELSGCSPGLTKLSGLALPRSTFQHVLGSVTQTQLHWGSLKLFRSLVICSSPGFFFLV